MTATINMSPSHGRGPAADEPPGHEDRLFDGGGEMGALMRTVDWAQTPFGPPAAWPQSLRTAVSMMLQSTFAMVVAWGPEFRFLYNDRYRPVLGSTKHPSALGAPAQQTFPEAWPYIGPLFQKTRSGEAVALDDVLIPLDRNGYLENCYFTLSYSPIRDESGDVGGMLAVVHETTRRVEGERRLATLRELAHGAAEAKTEHDACRMARECFERNSVDVPFSLLYLVDASGKQARLSASSGIPVGHVAAPELLDLEDTALTRRSWPLADVVRRRKTEVVTGIDARFGPMPGGPFPEHTHTAVLLPLFRPGTDLPYGVLVAGVSPRRAFDDLYRGFYELAAEHIVAAISNARAYEEERQRAEALAELDRAKTAFFSNVSHEFRTPLTLMLGPLEDMLAKPEAAPIDREQLTVVHRNGLRLLKLVNTLLEFSRIEAGRVDPQFEPTDLASFTTELAGVFRSAIEKAGLQLIVDCPPLPRPVHVDREMWEKIVLNLLSNALKFTFEGHIRVALRWCDSPSPGAELTVSDTGTGIPEAELPRIFQRFHRVPGARSRSHEGTGIGLAMIQELARIHGGEVKAASKQGAGATFTVRIAAGSAHPPRQPGTAERQRPQLSHSGAAFMQEVSLWLPSTAQAQTGERPADAPLILLADDNADMRQYVSRILGPRWRVHAVPDGQAALEAARLHRPQLVLSDVMMPRMDGFELLRQLRSDPALRAIPVILLSARAGEEASIEGLRTGADDYLVKPFSARELMARVATTLELSQLRAKVAASVEREHAAEALRASEERFRAIVSQATTGVAQIELDGRFTFVNDRYCEMVGYPRAELLQMRMQDLTHPEDLPGNLDQLRRMLEGGPSFEIEKRYIRKDGTHLWVSNSVTAIRDAAGVPRSVVAVSLDITQRRQAEEAMRESEARLRFVLDSMPQKVFTALPSGEVNYVNPQWMEYTGLSFEKIRDWGWTEFVHPDDVEENVLVWRRSIDTGEPFQFEHRFRALDGSYRWHITRVQPMRDRHGRSLVWIGSSTDVHEAKQLQESFRRSEEYFRELTQNMPLVVWTSLPDGSVDFVNSRWLEMTGQSLEYVRSNPEAWMIALHPEDREHAGNSYLHGIRSGNGFTMEARFLRTSDKTYRWHLNRCVPVFDASGNVLKFLGTCTDIEDQKRLEAELRDTDRRKDEFLAMLAHELRNPLAPIANATRLLRRDQTHDPVQQQARAVIERQVGRLTRLVDDLLEVSRITSGRIQLKQECISLEGIVQRAVETVSPLIEQHRHALTLALPAEPIWVRADSTRMEQVLVNLLNNAAKYTLDGGRIAVNANLEGNQAVIRVIDTGIGIEADLLPRVFDLFTQAERTLDRSHGGLGIGLSLVKRLVEMHGGTVQVHSVVGKGSEFVVRLPAVLDVSAAQPAEQAGARADVQQQPLRVLVVDDNVDAAETLAMLLAASGHSVRTAHDGPAALQAAATHLPHVAFLDIGLPKMDGYEVARRLLDNKALGAIELVAMTGYGQAADRQRSKASGFRRHLVKPVELGVVEGILAEISTQTTARAPQ